MTCSADRSPAERQTGDLVDREGFARIVFDIDGTREAARQRALPQAEGLPQAFRRLDEICAPGYTGRKRGEIVRTRTAHSVRPTVRNGSARLGTLAMDATEQNCVRLSRPSAAISQRITSRRNTPCCALMDNMAQGQ